MPSEFGLIGMIGIFISIGTNIIDSGLGVSLIRSKELKDIDYSTVFVINLLQSIIVYTIVYFSAPFIATFYNEPILVDLIRIYCLSFIINAFSSIQNIRLTKEMKFKQQMLISLPAVIVSSIVGLTLAYKNMGVWSLVYMHLVQSGLISLQLWFVTKWNPGIAFNFNIFKKHFIFGSKIMFLVIQDAIFTNIYHVIIGKFFSAAQLGFYTKAHALRQLPVTNISAALNKVTFPMFAQIQDDNEKLKNVYKKLMQQVLFWIAPSLTLAGILAEPLIRFLLTEKWLPTVPYFQILCLGGILYPLQSYNLNILTVKGKANLFVRVEFVKKAIVLTAILVGVQWGIIGLLWAQFATSITSYFINSYYSGQLIQYSTYEQLRDLLPTFGLTIVSGILSVALKWYAEILQLNDIFTLLFSGGLSFMFYFVTAKYLKLEASAEFITIIKKKI